MEYDNFKFRLDNLPGTILKRSDVYNSIRTPEGDAQVTWMANGTQWPGTWIDPTENHRKGDYTGIVKVLKFRLLVLDFLISSMYFLWNFCFSYQILHKEFALIHLLPLKSCHGPSKPWRSSWSTSEC
jgi:hypothetical protein